MKKKDPEARLAVKQAALISRTARALDCAEAEAAVLLRLPRHQSIRVRSGPVPSYAGQPIEWCPGGFELNAPITVVRDAPEVRSGSIYIQNAASWLPVLALDPCPTDRVLDVCAAPGGKTSHIRDLTGPQAEIWANDNSRARLAKLQANMRHLGVTVQEYTLFDAAQLGRKLSGQQFTKILLDAPCSGEGMMSLDTAKDFVSWSTAHIKRLGQLQKRILTQAWQLLAPGGTLVYSTCTMAPEENEAVIEYLLRTHADAAITSITTSFPNRVPAVMEWNGKKFSSAIAGCLRLQPSTALEAFFVCKLQKSKFAATEPNFY